MKDDNTLDVREVRNRAGKIRPVFPRHASTFVPNGEYKAVRGDGSLLLKITYRAGVVHGPYADYWPNGTTASTGQYRDGKQDGLWEFFHDDGTSMCTIVFENGKEVGQR